MSESLIPYMIEDEDAGGINIRLRYEKFNPEEIAGEDVIVSIFKKGHTVGFKHMNPYDKKAIGYGIIKYVKSDFDKTKVLWKLFHAIDPEEVDRIIRQMLDKINGDLHDGRSLRII